MYSRQVRPKPIILAALLALALGVGPALTESAAANDLVVVQPGQTLSEIAAQQGVSLARLVELNELADPNRIFAGQRLRIRAARPNGSDGSPRGARARRTVEHRVGYGETLWGLALRYGTSVGAIASANAIGDPSFVRAGQTLRVPVSARRSTPAQPSAAGVRHRVGYGDTLWGLALRYGTSVSAIARANAIGDPSFIRAGQALRIPGVPGGTDGWGRAPQGDGARLGRANASMPAEMAALVEARRPVGRLVVAEARRQGVPAAFALAVAWQESGWQPSVVSSAGAVGVMQLLPATAEWVGAAMLGGERVEPRDPPSNVRAGVRLLRHYLDRYDGSRSLALAAYYQGQSAADRYGVYPVSRPYIASILLLERLFAG